MKNYPVLVFCLAVFSCSTGNKTENTVTGMWAEDNAHRHILNRENPDTWDMKMLNDDISRISYHKDSQLPMEGIFPEPHYEIQMKGTFSSSGNVGGEVRLEGRNIFYESFFTGRNVNNAPYIGEKEDEIFFLILVLTDEDENEYNSHISSRNNPDIMGQGRFDTKDSKVDYIAFLTADRDNYAIVNGRLFNLRFGRTILVAPQKDGTFRSMQIDSPLMGADDIRVYVDSLIVESKVRGFFVAPGNIE